MEFGKIDKLENIDFSLPPDHSETKRFLASLAPSAQARIYIGATGWAMREWVGSLYPPKINAQEYLYHYAKQFDTIELNTTHYRIPDEQTVYKWKMAVPAHFRFAPKIPQIISHHRNLGIDTGWIESFAKSIKGLGTNLGSSFLQLPPYFSPEKGAILNDFLAIMQTLEIPLTVEFRHEKWFSDTKKFSSVFQNLEDKNIGVVITDVAGRRDVLHQRLTNKVVQIRLVGNSLDPTDFLRLDTWAAKIADWHQAGIEDIYLFLHQPNNHLIGKMFDYVAESIQKRVSVNIVKPVFYNKIAQQSLF